MDSGNLRKLRTLCETQKLRAISRIDVAKELLDRARHAIGSREEEAVNSGATRDLLSEANKRILEAMAEDTMRSVLAQFIAEAS